MFFLLKQTIKAAIQAASGASCTESRTEYAEVFSPEAVKEAKVSSPTPVLDPWEGMSQQQTDEVSEILSTVEDDVSESEKESMKDCAASAVMANTIRQLKNKLKSLQNKLIAVRKERFYSRRTGACRYMTQFFSSILYLFSLNIIIFANMIFFFHVQQNDYRHKTIFKVTRIRWKLRAAKSLSPWVSVAVTVVKSPYIFNCTKLQFLQVLFGCSVVDFILQISKS